MIRVRPPSLLHLLLPPSVAVLCAVHAASAQQGMEEVEIRTVPVAEGVYMLVGSGGNIGVSAGPDGVLLIDDQYAPLTERILQAVRGISPEPVRFVLNTHWHGDHTGGNENVGRTGAVLIAQDNVRARLGMEQVLERYGSPPDTVPPAAPGALPVITFSEEVTFHLNGDDLEVVHVPRAHTDGDAIVHFVNADVVHMGDTYFQGSWPFIDVSSGGTIDGLLAAQDRALDLMGPDTRVIPGHGSLATRADLERKSRILWTVRGRVRAAKLRGATLEEAQGMGLAQDWEDTLGGGFVSSAALVQEIWLTLPEGH